MATILVVDDDPAVRTNMTRLLKLEDHKVSEAGDGTTAAEALTMISPDLVLMDIVMPGKGGIESIMEIHQAYPSLAIVIMSGKVPLETEAMNSLVERYGAKAVLPKPFTADELIETVNGVLAGLA